MTRRVSDQLRFATTPDVLLLGTEWPQRALLRAELIEAGYDVIAVDAWPIPRMYRRPEMQPRLVIIDLQGLPEPRIVLDEIRFGFAPDRVLVVTSLGSVPPDQIRALGYHVVQRPTSIGDIVDAATAVLRSRDGE